MTTVAAPTDLGADQALLRDTVNKLLADPPAPPDQAAGRPGTWARLAQLGLLDIAVSAEAGGSGGSGLDLFVVAEAVGAHLTTDPWLPTAIGAMAVAAGGSHSLRAEVLPAVAAGGCRLAVTPDTLTGPRPTLHATANGGGLVLDGAAHGVVGGPTADRLVVIADRRGTADSVRQPVVALVDRETPGLSEATYRTVDDRQASDLAFSAVPVPAERILGPHTSRMVGMAAGNPSAAAWPVVTGWFDAFVAISDQLVDEALRHFERAGIAVGETGAAGLAALLELHAASPDRLQAAGLGPAHSVLLLCTEGRGDRVPGL
jgi:alkylation response protein AidB-like acyl-CoA dehydrogenase